MFAALLTAGAASASAAPVPFTMADQVNFDSGVFTFTATSPLCPSGTFVDDVNVAAFARSEQSRSGGGVLLIRSVYTCDDGAAFGLLNTTLSLLRPASRPPPAEILGGTGAYAGITGHGFIRESVGPIGGTGDGRCPPAVRDWAGGRWVALQAASTLRKFAAAWLRSYRRVIFFPRSPSPPRRLDQLNRGDRMYRC
jgi:hypothetical protein